MRICEYVHVFAPAHAYVYVYATIYICYVYVNGCAYACVYVYVYVNVYTNIYLYMCHHVHMHIHMYFLIERLVVSVQFYLESNQRPQLPATRSIVAVLMLSVIMILNMCLGVCAYIYVYFPN